MPDVAPTEGGRRVPRFLHSFLSPLFTHRGIGIFELEDRQVDLAAPLALRVDDNHAGRPVPLRQVPLEQPQPMLSGSRARGAWVLEQFAGGEMRQHLVLNVLENPHQVHRFGIRMTLMNAAPLSWRPLTAWNDAFLIISNSLE